MRRVCRRCPQYAFCVGHLHVSGLRWLRAYRANRVSNPGKAYIECQPATAVGYDVIGTKRMQGFYASTELAADLLAEYEK